MKPIKFLQIMLLATAGLVAACSAPKLAQNTATDDVYNTTAKAVEVEVITPRPQQEQPQQSYDDYYGTSNPYFDMDYSSRINRFYNGNGFNNYYDPYFNNYGNGYYGNGYYGNNIYNNNYLGYGLNWNNGYGLGYGNYYGSIWNNPFYYGNYGYNNGWGAYSIYDRYGYGGYYGGGYGGGYYGGGYGNNYYGGGIVSNPGRPRPGSNNNTGVQTGNNVTPNYGRPSRSGVDNRNNGNISNNGRPGNQSVAPGNAGNNNTRPQRQQQQPQQQQQQPQQQREAPSRPTRTETPTYSPPPSNNNGGSNNGGGNSGGGGGGRPSRAGRG
ncbi:hypothetical protein EZJ43_06335 [Pedobacter changchengzhani]|uniref:Prolyl-tRNA synthetase n=1 Tax=Pedobacter changchengzhani TaxID=2529274 RepID=A0A4V3A0B6_9SPHI|nr:hypothetical protein [Pedobacter changchengzhani]TDG36893.1 hypothetical protein EZJ43_06335 [Pedobacter changchengzhani]